MKVFLIILIRFFSAIDYFYRRLTQGLLHRLHLYKRTGHCLACGQCCKQILICMEPRFLKINVLREFATWWNSYFNGLHLLELNYEKGYMIYDCRHQLPNGQCGWRFWRPFFCREYPRSFHYFEVPTTLPGCGYKFVQKKAHHV